MNFGTTNATPAPPTNNTKKGILNSLGLGGLLGSSTNTPSVGGRRRKASRKASRKGSKKTRKGRKGSKKTRKGSRKNRKGSRKH